MNKIIIILLCLITTLPTFLNAQDEFAPVGAEWKYWTYNYFLEEYRFSKAISLKDSIIENKKCNIVAKTDINYIPTYKEIFYSENKKVYIYRNNKFNLLFDFAADIGDTITVFDSPFHAFFSKENSELFNKFEYIIEEIDSIQLSGVWFPRQKTKNIGDWEIAEIIYPLGAINNGYNNFLGRTSLDVIVEGGSTTYCYSDSNITVELDSLFIGCDEIILSSPVVNNNKQLPDFFIDNENNIIIDNHLGLECLLELIDLQGKRIKEIKISNKYTKVPFQNYLPNTIYLLRLTEYGSNNVLLTKKFLTRKN